MAAPRPIVGPGRSHGNVLIDCGASSLPALVGAAARLIDSAPYEEVVRRIGFGPLVRHWPEWRSRVRSSSARRGLDFLAEWLPKHHPELLA